MKPQRKIVMNHALAKALLDAGMEHFDGGGVVGGGGAGGILSNVAGAFTTQNTYNANLAPTQQSSYGGTIDQAGNNALAGYGTAQAIQAQQQQLAQALLAQSRGEGPNPAQAELNNQTGRNVANQAALMAGQRGGSANVGLMARQAAQAGAATQQQAVGQGAALEAQQQLSAEGALAGQQQAMQNANATEQGVNAGIYGTAAGAQNNQNNTNVSNYGMAQGINSQVSQNNTNAVNKNEGGLLNGIGGALKSVPVLGGLFAKGGIVGMPEHLHKMGAIYHAKRFADGGQVFGDSPGSISSPYAPNLSNAGAMSTTPAIGGSSSAGPKAPMPLSPGAPIGGAGATDLVGGAGASSSGLAGALASNPELLLAAQGGKIGGRAPVKGNSYKNDIVPAMLSPQEVVLPRDVTQSKDAPEKAAEFVKHLQDKKSEKGEAKFAPSGRSAKSLKDRIERLEKIVGRAA